MSVERMRRVFEINVLGAYLTAREAARRLMKSRGGPGGSIMLISSAAARLGSPNLYVDYAGAKGAIDTFTRGLSIELGPEGVRVNCDPPRHDRDRNSRQRRRAGSRLHARRRPRRWAARAGRKKSPRRSPSCSTTAPRPT